jgi:hypothetical protein
MSMGRCYISGPMSGLPEMNFPAFNERATILRGEGWDVVNPVDINPDPEADWYDCIVADIQAMKGCTAIYMLTGWESSPGANIERWVAIKHKMQIIYEQ